MWIILPKPEELKQLPTNPFGCKNLHNQLQIKQNMVTPPKPHPNTKMRQGGEGGNKNSQHQNQNHIKRNQNNKAPTASTNMQQHNSTVPQKGRQGHQRSKQSNNSHVQQQQNRTSPNLTNTNNHHNKNRQHQNQRPSNRQTPPRQVNMNNGQPSLVELTPSIATNPAPKNVVTQYKHSQKTSQNSPYQNQKGYTNTDQGSRSSPILNNLSKSNRSSPQCFAGSKCFEPPTPNSLPKPPSDWTPFQFPNKQRLFGNAVALTFDDLAETNPDEYLDNHFPPVSSTTARDVSQELKLILQVNS